MEFFDGRKVAFQSKVDSYGERHNARAPVQQSVTLRAKEAPENRRAILKPRLDLGGSGQMTAYTDRTRKSGLCPDWRPSTQGRFLER
jgi:hypothetical protein